MSEIGMCRASFFLAMTCTGDQANLGGRGELQVD